MQCVSSELHVMTCTHIQQCTCICVHVPHVYVLVVNYTLQHVHVYNKRMCIYVCVRVPHVYVLIEN